MFIKEEPAGRPTRAGVLAAANPAIAALLVYHAGGGTGLSGRLRAAPLPGSVALSPAPGMIPEGE